MEIAVVISVESAQEDGAVRLIYNAVPFEERGPCKANQYAFKTKSSYRAWKIMNSIDQVTDIASSIPGKGVGQ